MIPAAASRIAAITFGLCLPSAWAQLPPRGEPAKPQAPSPQEPSKPQAPAPLNEEENAKLKEQVVKLEKDLAAKRGGMHVSQLATLRAAMASNDKAYHFWEDCRKELDFDQQGKTAAEFAEWKRTQGKALSTNDVHCASLRLQIEFLALAIMQSHAETPAAKMEVCTAAITYVESLTTFCGKEEQLARKVLSSIMDTGADPAEVVTVGNLEERLKQVREAASALGGDILSGIFARQLKLDGSIHSTGEMAVNPGNIDEIYNRLIIKPYKDKKDGTALMAAWTRRITQTGRIAKATSVKEIEEKYELEKVPSMKWAMYKDQWEIGQQKTAAQSMIALISANPTHQDSSDWLDELKTLSGVSEK